MLFHITYEMEPSSRNDAQGVFSETGGPPPDGVEMIGRWHCAAGLKGYLIADTNDAEAIAKWMQDWTHLIRFDIDPVIGDEEMARVIG
ncbi:MAG: DUF3303 family protein [Gammaproteobacteria bacterium]|nr:DUF3303 family protein [Gammaproteobacteria bacterium]